MERHVNRNVAQEVEAPAPEAQGGILRCLLDLAPDAVVTMDPSGAILGFNPAAERMFGWTAAEVAGRNVALLMPDQGGAGHGEHVLRYLATGRRRAIGAKRTVIALRRSGRPFAAEISVGECRTATEHVFSAWIRDVSDLAAAERRADHLRRELAHLGRIHALGELASVMAHELNQPLAAIASYADACAKVIGGADGGGRAAPLVGHIAEEAHRAADIIRRMRDFLRRGEVTMRREDLNEIVRDAVLLCRAEAAAAEVAVALDLAPDLPAVQADRVQIQQVVVNLVRNAIEAVRDGAERTVDVASGAGRPAGPLRAVAMTVRRNAPDFVHVSVLDSGQGIADDDLRGIFRAFRTTKPGGLGVGLSISRSIIEAHGGRIWAENRPGGGAALHFTLPVAPDDA